MRGRWAVIGLAVLLLVVALVFVLGSYLVYRVLKRVYSAGPRSGQRP